MKHLIQLSLIILLGVGEALLGNTQAALAITWNWSYATPSVEASGTLTTSNRADSNGFFAITDISGFRNGVEIIGLQKTGTAIPGNEPFVVDNVISLEAEHLTADGLGFALADGTFVNVFYADFLEPALLLEALSAPPFVPGFDHFGPEDSEHPVRFSATTMP